MKINPKLEIRNPKQSRFGHFNLFRYSIFDIRYSRRGFTLIELLIYMAIFAVFLATAMYLFFASQTLEGEIVERQEVDRNVRVALSEMTQTIRAAQSVSSPALGATSSDLYLNNNAIHYFANSNGILQKTDSGQTYNITADTVSVENLSFTPRGEVGKQPTVSISFTLRTNTLGWGKSTYISKAVQTTVQLR